MEKSTEHTAIIVVNKIIKLNNNKCSHDLQNKNEK